MHKFVASAAADAENSALGRGVHEQPEANPLLRRWGTTINGRPTAAVMHDCWYMSLDDGFNESTAKLAIAAIDHIAKSDAPAILIHVNSYGGSVYSLLPILDKLDAVRFSKETQAGKPIITVCSQKAMSCGAVLFLYGDVRHMVGPHSEIMIHPVSSWHEAGQENALQSAARAHQLERLNSQLFEAMHKHTNIDWNRQMRDAGVGGIGQEVHLTADDLRKIDPDMVSYSAEFTCPCIDFDVTPKPNLGAIGTNGSRRNEASAFAVPEMPAEVAPAASRVHFRARGRTPVDTPAAAAAAESESAAATPLRMSAAAICAAFSNGLPAAEHPPI